MGLIMRCRGGGAYLMREALAAKLETAVREGKGGFNEGAVA
jgi:hypothetical protein